MPGVTECGVRLVGEESDILEVGRGKSDRYCRPILALLFAPEEMRASRVSD